MLSINLHEEAPSFSDRFESLDPAKRGRCMHLFLSGFVFLFVASVSQNRAIRITLPAVYNAAVMCSLTDLSFCVKNERGRKRN